jgi:probable HAF family extracellular repeat protein
MHDLGTLGGDFAAALAVDGNIIVGYSFTPGDAAMHAFAYNLATTGPMQDLGTLGGSTSVAMAVSGTLVVGYSTVTGDSGYHAVSWDLGTTPPTMQDLAPAASGATDSQALGVSSSSDLVAGWANPANNIGTDLTDWSVTNSTTTPLTSSVNPASATQALTYTAKVSPTATGGTVAFSQNGTPIAGCKAVTVSTGVAKCPTTAGTATGGHKIVAKYSGAGLVLGSTSPTLTEMTKPRVQTRPVQYTVAVRKAPAAPVRPAP